MVYVGLTGGIGAGKSEVARLLRKHGALVIDSDLLAREVVEPGSAGIAAMLDEFGPDVLRADGTLNRQLIAQRVFSEPTARERLNAIVHPLVRARAAELRAAAAPGDVVVHDVPLLVENNLEQSFDVVVVVSAPVEHRVQRLLARGMSRADAQARMEAQATDEQRAAVADFVIVNDDDLPHLARETQRIWDALA